MTKPNLQSSPVLPKPTVFFPNLDGLRFFCFLVVFLFHSFYTEYDHIKSSSTYLFVRSFLFKNGNLGVNFFFVLSGFLITYLLLKEKEFYGKINVLNFWKRRILRIWPLFFACVFFGFVIFPVLKNLLGQESGESANVFSYLTFLNNFDLIKNGLPDASVLGVLWSVAIEEQFYFVWPLLLIVIPSQSYKYVFFVIIFLTLVFRGIFDNSVYNEYHTLSCIGDMTVGGLGALLIHTTTLDKKIATMAKGYIVALYAAVVLIFLFRDTLQSSYYLIRVSERILIAVVFLMVILEQNYAKNSLFKMGNFKLLSELGTISYGLYCLHFIGILVTTNTFKILHFNNHLWQVLILETTFALVITVIIAKLSYRYFESPFLRLKHKLSFIRTPEK
ncbi:acyltransferase [Chryseolinea sp. H1M3-3]|uniref:acyltransferase family protein n=1 Tax=Chryseolinea sp. H1M3-3 TaxID=3034144 RepID=UPI0023ECB408|nr:acyltransferase [Chryseolinea sp. H1M3-3]